MPVYMYSRFKSYYYDNIYYYILTKLIRMMVVVRKKDGKVVWTKRET